jgi:hypothetical protein
MWIGAKIRTYFKLKEEFVLGGSQAYPYLLLLQVKHVLWLKVDGDDQRYLEPRFTR